MFGASEVKISQTIRKASQNFTRHFHAKRRKGRSRNLFVSAGHSKRRTRASLASIRSHLCYYMSSKFLMMFSVFTSHSGPQSLEGSTSRNQDED